MDEDALALLCALVHSLAPQTKRDARGREPGRVNLSDPWHYIDQAPLQARYNPDGAATTPAQPFNTQHQSRKNEIHRLQDRPEFISLKKTILIL
jgi:hypothetical protein